MLQIKFLTSQIIKTKRSILHRQKIIRIEQIHMLIDLLVRDDPKVNFEMTKRSIFIFTFGPKGQSTLNNKTRKAWKKLPCLKVRVF